MAELGFDVYEDNRDFEKEGITGKVQRYSIENVEYPFLMLHASEENPVHKHQLEVLPNMFACTVTGGSTTKDNGIVIYYTDDKVIARLGKILPRQVKAFLRLFDGNEIDGMLDESHHLQGDYLYVLAE